MCHLALQVVWRRASDPNPITIGPMTYVGDKRFRLEHAKNSVEWNLRIANTSLLDSGVYECQVSSRTRSIRQLVLLNVEGTSQVYALSASNVCNGSTRFQRRTYVMDLRVFKVHIFFSTTAFSMSKILFILLKTTTFSTSNILLTVLETIAFSTSKIVSEYL